mgnify:CR=1 FL=1
MKSTTIYFGILLFCLCSSAAQAAKAEQPNLSPLIKKETACFPEPLNNYDAFIKRITKGKPEKVISSIKQSISRADFDRYMTEVICKKFSYEVDGLLVSGIYAMPRNKSDKPLPAVIFNRGGNADFGTINPMVSLRRLLPLAEQGYFIIASQYRGSNGKDNNGVDEFGGRDVNDVVKLVDIIDTIPLVNNKKIALWGGSRGGMMALMTARNSDRFSAIILASTPVDLFAELNTTHGQRMEKSVFKKRIPDYEKNKKAVLTNRSAILWAEQLSPKAPILIMHSRDDDRVDPANSLRFASRLQELKFPYKLVIYETGGHTLENRQAEYDKEVSAWLQAYLR